jgi:hypothetical protein
MAMGGFSCRFIQSQDASGTLKQIDFSRKLTVLQNKMEGFAPNVSFHANAPCDSQEKNET